MIVAIIVVAIVIIAGIISDNSEKRMKIEAALRAEEMRRGYMPGTYSRTFSSKRTYKKMMKANKKTYKNATSANDFKAHENADLMDREELERAIKELEKRIENLDTILREKGRKNG